MALSLPLGNMSVHTWYILISCPSRLIFPGVTCYFGLYNVTITKRKNALIIQIYSLTLWFLCFLSTQHWNPDTFGWPSFALFFLYAKLFWNFLRNPPQRRPGFPTRINKSSHLVTSYVIASLHSVSSHKAEAVTDNLQKRNQRQRKHQHNFFFCLTWFFCDCQRAIPSAAGHGGGGKKKK